MIQALNYSTQAMGELTRLRERLGLEPEKAEVTEFLGHVTTLIECSHKFMMPEGGFLFELSPEKLESMSPLFRLPFNTVSLEFRTPTLGHIDKIVILCQEDELGDSASLWPIPCVDGNWLPFNGIRVKYGPDNIGHDPSGENCLLYSYLKIRGLDVSDRAAQTMRNCALSAACAAIQLCAALKCSNVSTERLDPPVKLQAKRAKEGKLPLFSYHILTVGDQAVCGSHANHGGTHSAPRTHLRRGHIRNHPTAGFIWVNSCVVNPGAKGSVNKDYAVEVVRP